MSSLKTPWILFDRTLEIILYNIGQQAMGIKSLTALAFSFLGSKETKVKFITLGIVAVPWKCF